MRRNRRPAPSIRCDAWIELWGPHDGCREFMSEPEISTRCPGPATHVAKYHPDAFHYPYELNGRARVCIFHAKEARGDSECRGVYRFRTVHAGHAA